MYPHLIEVHDGRDGGLITLHIAAISSFYTYEGKVHINMVSNDDWMVSETYDEIKALIHDAGCAITKKDPRLDNKPMAWDDFKGQEGEIFYNSNLLEWWLFERMINLENGTKWLSFRDYNGITQEVYPDDLKAKPMYRMKVTDEPEPLSF